MFPKSYDETYTMRSRFFQTMGLVGRFMADAFREADKENQDAIADTAFQAMKQCLFEHHEFQPHELPGGAGPITFRTTHIVSTETIGFMLVGEFEGNPMSSWVGRVIPENHTTGGLWYDDDEFIASPDFRFTVHHDDPETGDDGDYTKTTQVDRQSIAKGLSLMAAKSPDHFADLLSESSADAVTYDVAFQYIVLGEIVYG